MSIIPREGPARYLVAAVAVLVVVFAIVRMLPDKPKQVSEDRIDVAKTLAEFAAQQATKAAPSGGTALIIRLGGGAYNHEYEERFNNNLKKAFQAADFDVAFEEATDLSGLESRGEPFSLEALLGMIQRHPDTTVVVSRLGFPVVTREGFGTIPQDHPAFMILTDFLVPHLDRLPPGLITLSATPRSTTPQPEETRPAGLPDLVFNHYNVKAGGS